VRLDLAAAEGRVARLSLDAAGEGTVRVVAPRVLGRAPRRGGAVVPAPQERRKPNLLLYVVDTLRADRLGCYGYPAPTSPRIDALAAQGLLFTNTIAQSSWTTPATASILTGRYPLGHGALMLGRGMRPDVPTLAEVLRAAGYRTGAFVTNGNVTGALGFQRGFDQYVYLAEDRRRPTIHVTADVLHERALSWLRDGDGRPFFLYLHASDPHAPYAPPEAVAKRFRPPGPPAPIAEVADPVRAIIDDPALRTPANVAHLGALYDAEVAFTDDAIGQLLDQLHGLGVSEETLVVLTADHGEELHDHGRFGHGHSLYAELTRVPLILRLPGHAERARRIDSLARQIDVVPTVLDSLGVATPAGVDGRSLLPDVAAAGAPEGEAFSQTRLGNPPKTAVVTAAWKIIETLGRERRFEVYDLRADAGERHDLASRAPVLVGYGRQLLTQWMASAPRPRHPAGGAALEPIMDEGTRRRLEAVGYVN
jgi:arylsulfatase A-like enzyme